MENFSSWDSRRGLAGLQDIGVLQLWSPSVNTSGCGPEHPVNQSKLVIQVVVGQQRLPLLRTRVLNREHDGYGLEREMEGQETRTKNTCRIKTNVQSKVAQ